MVCEYPKQKLSLLSGDCAVDVLFVLESSWYMSSHYWVKVLQFVNDVYDGLDIGTDKAQAAVIVFTGYSYVKCGFTGSLDRTDFKQCISRLSLVKKKAYLGGALRTSHEVLDKHKYGERSSVPNIVIVVSTGVTYGMSDTKKWANELHKLKDTDIYTIAFGYKTDKNHLKDIDSDYFFDPKSLTELLDDGDDILDKICEDDHDDDDDDDDDDDSY